MNKKRKSVLLLYTGGTIGMIQDVKSGELKPFDFSSLSEQIPELSKFNLDLNAVTFNQPIDSSDMHPKNWIQLAEIIKNNYNKHTGFVILHGSDTMAFTASALSFMLENLAKPVILTGSQLPMGIIRTDGKENLITAIEIASATHKNGDPVVPEVCIYFEYRLYRGNRTFKYSSKDFDAFKSPNYSELAEAGVEINYNLSAINKLPQKKLKVHLGLENDVAVLKIFPGISKKITESVLLTPGIKAVVLETFGAGNCLTEPWFTSLIKKVIDKNIIVLNITQCKEGRVIQGMYQTSTHLQKAGVIPGADMTFEASITKLMFLLGKNFSIKKTKSLLVKNLRGELSE
ncbi:MAG: asparaginase [Bacteroidota bacterium]|jgi:L-asparaginase